MRFNRYVVTILAGVVVSISSGRIYAQARIAVVDLQRAINETEDGRRAKARLKRTFDKRQEVLDKRQGDLKKLKEEIEKQRNVLSRPALDKKMEDYQKSFVELQTTYVEYQRELAQKEAQLTKSILDRMQNILRRIGQTESYTLIVERNEGGIVWVPSHMDVTDQLIQRY